MKKKVSYLPGFISLIILIFIFALIFPAIQKYNNERKAFEEVRNYNNYFLERGKYLYRERDKIIDEITLQSDKNEALNKKIQLIDDVIENENKMKYLLDSFRLFINNNIYLKNKNIDVSNYNKLFKVAIPMYDYDIRGLENIKLYNETKNEYFYKNYLKCEDSVESLFNIYNSIYSDIFNEKLTLRKSYK